MDVDFLESEVSLPAVDNFEVKLDLSSFSDAPPEAVVAESLAPEVGSLGDECLQVECSPEGVSTLHKVIIILWVPYRC